MLFASKHPGFTLIEVMISTAIFAILTTMIIVNFMRRSDEDAVKQSTNQIVLDLQQMMTAAQSGQKYLGASIGGYGVYINNYGTNLNSYIKYADIDSNGTWTGTNETIAIRKLLPSQSPLVRFIGFSTTFSSYFFLNVGYAVPGAGITLKGKLLEGNPWSAITDPVIIKLKHTKKSLYSCIQITPIGVGVVTKITCP